MKRTIFTKLAAAMTLLLYVASSVGIDVHRCDCTGHVCAHIAFYFDDIHDTHHDCHHCGHEAGCGDESHHHDCCHNDVYRVAVAGDRADGCTHHISTSSVQIPAHCCELSVCMPAGIHCSNHVPDTPPPVGSHDGSIFILRV